MKALRFIFLLLLAVIPPSLAVAPYFAFQKVTFSIITRDSVLDLTYWWDIERRILGTAFRNQEGFQREGDKFVRRLQGSQVVFRIFDGEHPRTVQSQVTGIITFYPPRLAVPDPTVPVGTLPPGIYASNPDASVRLFDSNGRIRIAYVVVSILPPLDRDPYDTIQKGFHQNFQRMEVVIRDFPTLPEPNLGFSPTGIFTPQVDLEFRLNENQWQRVLDNSFWETEDKDILCTAVDHNGLVLQAGRAVNRQQPGGSPSWWDWLPFYMGGEVSVSGRPNNSRNLYLDPIWDCSDEASTSGTKDDESTNDPKDELRKRRLSEIRASRDLGGFRKDRRRFDGVEGAPI
jgi:hypothetical protein